MPWIPCLALALPAVAQHHFDAVQSLRPLEPAGETLTVRGAGDLDGDGDIDLVAHSTSGSFHALDNDGEGRMTLGPPHSADAGSNAFGGLADVSGDGDPDVVGLVGTTVQVSTGLPGSGFAPPASTVVSLISVGDFCDFDGDGRSDCAVVRTQDKFQWLVSDGAASFHLTELLQLPAHVDTFGASSVRAIDLGSDGDGDAVLSGKLGKKLILVRTDGALAAEVLDVEASGLWAGPLSQPVDLDGDGDEDLLMHSLGSLQPLLQDRDGAISFGAPIAFTGGVGDPFHVVDWDLDGDLDVAGTLLDSFSGQPLAVAVVYERTADGMGPPRRYPIVSGYSNADQLVAVADLDTDGLPDLVLKRHIAFGDGAFTSPATPLGAMLFETAIDLDGDLDLDLLDLRDDHDLSSVFEDTLNTQGFRADGAGGGTWFDLVPPPPGDYTWSNAVLGDFDGDGVQDLLAERRIGASEFLNVIELLRLVDDALIPTAEAAPIGSNLRTGALAADVDLDGDLDVISHDDLWRNDGTPYLTPGAEPFLPGVLLDLADADEDGDVDYLVRAQIGSAYALSLALGEGALAPLEHPLGVDLDFFGSGATFQDVDADGDLDVVGWTPLPTPWIFGFENAGGAIGMSAVSLATPPIPVRDVTVGDVDADGTPELFARRFDDLDFPNENVFEAFVFEGDLPWSLPRTAEWYFHETVGGFADLDRDGDTDVYGVSLNPAAARTAASGGSARQFGHGNPGTGGITPLLNVDAPLLPDEVFTVRLSHALPGTLGVVVASTSTVELADFPLTGLTGYVVAEIGPIVFPIPAAGGPGSGGIALQFPLNGAVLPPLYLQAFQLDPAATSGVAATNAVEAIVAFESPVGP